MALRLEMVTDAGADALFRVGASLDLPVIKWLPDGSYLSYIADPKMKSRASAKLRAGELKITDLPGFYVRVIEYQVPDRGDSEELITLVTTILDPVDATAVDLAAVYHERWEIETLIDEIKTHQRGSAVVLRSRKPDLVEQEIWGLLLTHYGIRHLMCEAADQAELDPDRLSFIRSIRVIRRQVSNQAAFPPQLLAGKIKEAIKEIGERPNHERRQRTCPRKLKRARHNSYQVKRETDRNIRHDSTATIQLICPAA